MENNVLSLRSRSVPRTNPVRQRRNNPVRTTEKEKDPVSTEQVDPVSVEDEKKRKRLKEEKANPFLFPGLRTAGPCPLGAPYFDTADFLSNKKLSASHDYR